VELPCFFLVFVIHGILMMDWIANNFNDCAARPNGAMIMWAMILACFIFALFLTLMLKWSGAKKVTDGLKIGLVFGLLHSFSTDLAQYSMSTVFNSFTSLIVDVLVWSVIAAIMGIIIVLTCGKEKQLE
jgi:hypothetical protein